MTLDDYCKLKGYTDRAFADLIGVTRPSVTRYRAGTSRPDWTVMDEIMRVTNHAVMPNDFIRVQSQPWVPPAGKLVPPDAERGLSADDELDAVVVNQVIA
jgi:transcriptional regulator with XRE-family HTH domain